MGSEQPQPSDIDKPFTEARTSHMKPSLSSITITLFLGLSVAANAGVTGQWDFNGNFSASIGTAIVPQGVAVSGSAFGTTTSFGIPNIGGQVAQVLRFPQMPTSADGYQMFPGAAANGSTSDVNQYSLVMDILFPSASTGYRALFQTSASNNNDADWFVNGSNAIGINNSYYGNLTADTWHRIALVVDLEQPNTALKFASYMDGVLVGYSDLTTLGAPGGRFSVWPASSGNPSWIFSDNDGETALGYVNSVQFSNFAMTAAQIALLGGPSANGIPVIPEPAAGLLLVAGLLVLSRRAVLRA
jgi:hypothetical protein